MKQARQAIACLTDVFSFRFKEHLKSSLNTYGYTTASEFSVRIHA